MVHCMLAKGVHMQKVAPGETGIEGYGKKMKQSRECHWHMAQELTWASRTSNDDNELQAWKF